jgi:ATP-dependent Clp protease, protease subunit
MLYLNAEDTSQGLFMYINSPGGSVTCGIGVYDAMNYIQSDVTTICVGTAASMASFVLSGGTRGKRLALPHSRIMIHQPGGGSQGQTSIVLSEAEEMLRIRNEVVSIYADRTGQSLSRISQDMNRDQFMSVREAKEYGLVDQIASDIMKYN